jgi:DNA repair exonuclease SbcCD ATPase subunit
VKLIQFKAKNLFALGDVKLDLNNRGLVLITGYSEDEHGANGAGKSSLANKGILWTLFGETAGGLRADAVRNRHNKKKCRGEVLFEGTDGAKYTVRRERPAKLFLFKGKEDISTTKATETQLLINSLLGIDFKTFLQTSFFGQGRKLSYAALAPKEQKAVLEQILPMEDADRWGQYADVKVKEVAKLINKAERAEWDADASLKTHAHHVADVEKRLKEFFYHKDAAVRRAERALQSWRDSTSVDAQKLEILEKQIAATDIDGLEEEIAEFHRILTELADGPLKAAEALYKKALDSASQWKSRGTVLRHEIKELEKATSCPTCLRDFDDQTVLGVKKRILQQKTMIVEADTNFAAAEEALSYHSNDLSIIRRQAQFAHEAIAATQNQQLRVSKAQREAEALKTNIQGSQLTLEATLKREQEQQNPFIEQLEEVKQAFKAAEADLIAHKKIVEDLKRESEHLIYWRDVYSKELKLKMFEDACPFLDARVAYHLNKLKNRQLHAKFTTIKRLATGDVKEEFNVEVVSDTGGMGFDSLSGGEQQMVSFAIGLALSDLSSRTSAGRSSFTVLDEPFSELDAKNSEAIVEYLVEEMCKEKETVFLISNEDALKGLVSNRVHVVKKQGVSNVDC